jgi:hypothetical protein
MLLDGPTLSRVGSKFITAESIGVNKKKSGFDSKKP